MYLPRESLNLSELIAPFARLKFYLQRLNKDAYEQEMRIKENNSILIIYQSVKEICSILLYDILAFNISDRSTRMKY